MHADGDDVVVLLYTNGLALHPTLCVRVDSVVSVVICIAQIIMDKAVQTNLILPFFLVNKIYCLRFSLLPLSIDDCL